MHPDETLVESGVVAPFSDSENEIAVGIETDEADAASPACAADGIPKISPDADAESIPETADATSPTAVDADADAPSFLRAEYEKLAAEMPEGLPFTTLAAYPALGAFLLLREKGVSSREAYLALEQSAAATPIAADLSHLRAAAPQTIAPSAPVRLSQETMREWRRIFPHLSDKEIAALYRRTAPQTTL